MTKKSHDAPHCGINQLLCRYCSVLHAHPKAFCENVYAFFEI